MGSPFVAKQYNSKDKKKGCFYQQLLMIFTPLLYKTLLFPEGRKHDAGML